MPYLWQDDALARHYTVRANAAYHLGVGASAFTVRRSLIVGPQKLGKDPLASTVACLEGMGPSLFGGWAGPDDGYSCADHGCPCGWEYPYELDEPMGAHWATPLIQITAVSEDATDNTYDVLRPMIEMGPLSAVVPRTGEEFIRLPGGGRIETVTSSAPSRLGQRVTLAIQGEAGLWTAANRMTKVADTQYRNLSGTGGRAFLLTNPWDPGEHSVAQQVYESPATDIQRHFPQPPALLSFVDRRERHRILRANYPPDTLRENGGHIDLDSIEAEAADLAARDLAQAQRFYGQRLVAGSGKAFDPMRWKALEELRSPVDGLAITLGFDGSKSGDWSALVACELVSGWMWPLDIWAPDPVIDIAVVNAAVDAAMARFRVVRMYVDPPYWKDELAAWQGRYGDKVVLSWETYRPRPIGHAVREFAQAIAQGSLHHSGDEALAQHVANAYRRPLMARDDRGEPLWTIAKESPDSSQKIDAAMAAVLAWEARRDAIAAGLDTQPFVSIYETRGIVTI